MRYMAGLRLRSGLSGADPEARGGRAYRRCIRRVAVVVALALLASVSTGLRQVAGGAGKWLGPRAPSKRSTAHALFTVR